MAALSVCMTPQYTAFSMVNTHVVMLLLVVFHADLPEEFSTSMLDHTSPKTFFTLMELCCRALLRGQCAASHQLANTATGCLKISCLLVCPGALGKSRHKESLPDYKHVKAYVSAIASVAKAYVVLLPLLAAAAAAESASGGVGEGWVDMLHSQLRPMQLLLGTIRQDVSIGWISAPAEFSLETAAGAAAWEIGHSTAASAAVPQAGYCRVLSQPLDEQDKTMQAYQLVCLLQLARAALLAKQLLCVDTSSSSRGGTLLLGSGLLDGWEGGLRRVAQELVWGLWEWHLKVILFAAQEAHDSSGGIQANPAAAGTGGGGMGACSSSAAATGSATGSSGESVPKRLAMLPEQGLPAGVVSKLSRLTGGGPWGAQGEEDWKAVLEDVCGELLVEVPSHVGCANPRCCNLKGESELEVSCYKCAQCNQVAYCSRDCQIAHWPVHKKVCKTWREGQQEP